MEPQVNLSSFVLVVLSFSFMMICSSEAYTFYVGGKDGWVLNPSLNYNRWAEINRFQVNDTLIFRYKKECNDSVLVVSKDDYYKCNKENPIDKLTDDVESKFIFNRSGAFFFISGHDDNCEKGQKLIIVVMAVRNKTRVLPPAPETHSPSPAPWLSPSVSPAEAESPNADASGSGQNNNTPSPAPWLSPSPAEAESPNADAPGSGQNTLVGLAPAPAKAAAVTHSGSWVVLGLSIGMSMVLGRLAGLF